MTLTPASDREVTVEYATVDGVAEAGVDYESTSGTLTFAPGATEQTITVTLIDDEIYFGTIVKRFGVVLSSPVGATLPNVPIWNVHIEEDDPEPGASIENVQTS